MASVPLPLAPSVYDIQDQQQNRSLIATALGNKRSKDEDVELIKGQRLIMRSPSGQRWQISVSDIGALIVATI